MAVPYTGVNVNKSNADLWYPNLMGVQMIACHNDYYKDDVIQCTHCFIEKYSHFHTTKCFPSLHPVAKDYACTLSLK